LSNEQRTFERYSMASDETPQQRIAKLTKINEALMKRVERSMDHQANAYSLFQTAIGLETQVRSRTEELKRALIELERTNEQLVIARDASERANRVKTRFFTAVGHDLLQPLHAARISLSAISATTTQPEHTRILNQIDHALSTVDALLATILDLSKLEEGMLKPSLRAVPLDDLFRSLVLDLEPLAEEKGLELRYRPTNAAVVSDPLMLRRILQNLLANAVQYTRKGGVLVGARVRQDHVRIDVWDTGPGIAAEERQNIFEEFQRGAASEHAATGGFGLGLSIVKRMANALEHPIDLRSREGRGTCISVDAPLAAPGEANIAPPFIEIVQPYDFSGITVTVIYDDLAVGEAMTQLLTQWGCSVHIGTKLDDVARMLDDGVSPAIILADYHLENGACGLEAVARMRSACEDLLPAIVISADKTDAVLAKVQNAGCEFLSKPAKPAELRALMHHLLRRCA